jgi:serine/threonine-protein kinase
MRAELKGSQRDREMFIQEARMISQLTHPHIVGIHDIVDEGGELYLVFDYIDGKPLSAVLDEYRRLSLPDSVRVLEQVCKAVEHAHQARIEHRDLKPSNIMIDKGGNAWVMDFGLARMAKDTVSRLSKLEFAGTPAFMAPEQHLGRPARASDVFALGVCVYEMLSGELPFRGPDFLAQKERMMFAPLSTLPLGLPAGIDAVIGSALAADPAKRPAGPLDLYNKLKALV